MQVYVMTQNDCRYSFRIDNEDNVLITFLDDLTLVAINNHRCLLKSSLKDIVNNNYGKFWLLDDDFSITKQSLLNVLNDNNEYQHLLKTVLNEYQVTLLDHQQFNNLREIIGTLATLDNETIKLLKTQQQHFYLTTLQTVLSLLITELRRTNVLYSLLDKRGDE